MSNSQQPLLPFEPSETSLRRDWLGLQIDHREFLGALQDEWLCPVPDHYGRVLGVATYPADPTRAPQKENNLITVSLRFSMQFLPDAKSLVHSSDGWRQVNTASLPADADFIYWRGAIPLFALTEIVVESPEKKTRLLGLARQASNVSMPDIEINVERVSTQMLKSSGLPPVDEQGIGFTEDYSRVRGSMAMAVWAVPRIDPWFNILVASLSGDTTRVKSVAETMAAPYYTELPWLPHSPMSRCDPIDCRLWKAALEIFAADGDKGQLDATTMVERIANHAAFQDKCGDTITKEWREQTISVLRGKETFGLDDWQQCPVGKALQLLLLRPEPERFSKWSTDLPDIPPEVWFSAAILLGYLYGYRQLPTGFRGNSIQRRTLAIRALNVTSDSPKHVKWPFPDAAQLSWRREKDEIVFTCGEYEFTRKTAHARTLWYVADFGDAASRDAAERLARREEWKCFKRQLTLRDSSFPFVAHSNGKLSIRSGALVVQGGVDFDLPETAYITESFDRIAFQRCIASEGARNIPFPPANEVSERFNRPDRKTNDHPVVHGLLQVEGFLTAREEEELITHIDASEWLGELKRRVQHYGWRYDYKSRQIKRDMRIGPLPAWAAAIAERLAQEQLLPHVPDQVIVNEYIRNQGIAKHVDCEPCFDDGIAMISLLESWEMSFTKGSQRELVLLPQRSATILSGEARYEWTHEIPKRVKEPSGLIRERRISITFRKVVLDTPSRPRSKGATNTN